MRLFYNYRKKCLTIDKIECNQTSKNLMENNYYYQNNSMVVTKLEKKNRSRWNSLPDLVDDDHAGAGSPLSFSRDAHPLLPPSIIFSDTRDGPLPPIIFFDASDPFPSSSPKSATSPLFQPSSSLVLRRPPFPASPVQVLPSQSVGTPLFHFFPLINHQILCFSRAFIFLVIKIYLFLFIFFN